MSNAGEAVDPSSFEEPVRILSDIHFGHPGCKVISVEGLRPVLEGAGTVLFNGDTFEFKKLKVRSVTEGLKVELEALCAELGARPIYLTGNHDSEISDLHYLDFAGGKIFLTHGDLLYDDVSPWSKLIDSIHEQRDIVRAEYPDDYLEDLELRLKAAKQIALRSTVRQIDAKQGLSGKIKSVLWEAWPPRRPMKILETWARAHHVAHALRDQFRPEAEFIIIGHTHRAMVHRAGGKHVINTGAYLPLAKASFVEIAGGVMRVVDCTPSGGVCRVGREHARFDL